MEDKELFTEETTPMEEATNEETTPETEPAPEQAEESNVSAEAPETAPEEDFILRYKHADLSVTKDEAKRLAQMGKHYEDNIKKTIDDLDYYATLQGKNIKDVVKELIEGAEKSYREELEFSLGADNPLVEEMLELKRSKNRKAYDDALSAREAEDKKQAEENEANITTRLAEQFEAVKSEFPEMDTIDKIPDSVLKRAIEGGDLEKEMLRYERQQRKSVEAQKATDEKNKNENLGSAQSERAEDSVISAMMRGMWGQ